MRIMKHRGFTLIELLVVIAIIAVLAAILFPVFARAKAVAGDARSISNAKQLGAALMLYLGDNDDTLPQVAEGPEGTSKMGGWTFYTSFGNSVAGTFDVTRGSIYPYITDRHVFQTSGDPDALKSGNSFAFNGALAAMTGTGMNPGVSATSVAYPADQMLLAEEGCGGDSIVGYGYNRGTNDGYFNVAMDHFAKFHPGGAVVLFVDGHAKIRQAQDWFVQTVCGTDKQCWN